MLISTNPPLIPGIWSLDPTSTMARLRGAARNKTRTARDKTGTATDKTGTVRDKTGTATDKKGTRTKLDKRQ